MKVTVLAFGIAKEFFNGSAKEVELPEGATVAVLKSILEAAHPEMKRLHAYFAAVNEEYAEDDLVICPDDEIAIIPPVSGG